MNATAKLAYCLKTEARAALDLQECVTVTDHDTRDETPSISFSNGVSAPFAYNAVVDLEKIADLNFGAIIAAIIGSNERYGSETRGPLAPGVRIPSADRVFGIDLGYRRLPPLPKEPGYDKIAIYEETATLSICAYHPVIRDGEIVEDIIRAVTRGTKLDLVSMYFGASDGQEYWDVDLRVAADESFGRATEICQLILALLHGGSPLPSDPVSAVRVLASNRWDTFLGAIESEWLEAKKVMYGLDDARQRFELGLDVASFANSPSGGIIIVGFGTSKDDYGQDAVSDIQGLTRLDGSVPRLESIIQQLIYPLPEGLSVNVFRRDGRDVLAILIPPQSAERSPFLVSGAEVEGDRMYGQGFAWVERRGSSKRAVSVAEVHLRLSSSYSTSDLSGGDS